MSRLLCLLSSGALLRACAEQHDVSGLAGLSEHRDDSLGLATGAVPNAFDGYNDPSLLLSDAVRRLEQLPLQGSVAVEPWSGSYWPEYKGGIAYRWRTGEAFVRDFMSRSEALQASADAIHALSPAEKYDLYTGNYGWSLTQGVLGETSPTESGWTGYCHGWAPAAASYDEPEPVTVRNPDGIEFTFGSSDIKALLTYYRGSVVISSFVGHDWARPARVVGTVCGSANPIDPACHDTNPGTFHIVMANQLGLAGEHVLFDVDPTYEKWNQPAWAYRSTLVESREPARFASMGTVTEVLMRTELDYTIEIEPTHDTVLGTAGQHSTTLVLHYTLDLDAEGQILGGQWQVPLQEGGFASLDEVWSYYTNADENHDGKPDYSEDEVSAIIWANFRFPDYLWLQDEPEWSQEPAYLSTGWELVSTTSTSRQVLYDYFAMVQDLL